MSAPEHSLPNRAQDAETMQELAARVTVPPDQSRRLSRVLLDREECTFLADMIDLWYGGGQDPEMRDLAARLRAGDR